MDNRPTHHLPMHLQHKLVEAKEWYDERDLNAMDEEQEKSSDAVGAALMIAVLEMMDAEGMFTP